jgi:hypothetical protein
MHAVRRSRNAVAIGITFLIVGLAYLFLADPLGYRIEWAGVTMLVALGAAMGLMAYVLVAGSPRD